MFHWEMKPNHLSLLRVWHHENYIVHGDGKAPITVSITYLCSYVSSFLGCNGSTTLHPKGKSPLLPDQSFIFLGPPITRWAASGPGILKANADAGWDAMNKRASITIIILDYCGSVIISEWKFIPSCGRGRWNLGALGWPKGGD
jgi:hypothetical protein